MQSTGAYFVLLNSRQKPCELALFPTTSTASFLRSRDRKRVRVGPAISVKMDDCPATRQLRKQSEVRWNEVRLEEGIIQ